MLKRRFPQLSKWVMCNWGHSLRTLHSWLQGDKDGSRGLSAKPSHSLKAVAAHGMDGERKRKRGTKAGLGFNQEYSAGEVKRAKVEHQATEIELEVVIEHGLRLRVSRTQHGCVDPRSKPARLRPQGWNCWSRRFRV